MKPEQVNLSFTVVDNNTGEEADVQTIAQEEEWAQQLFDYDISGFAITQDGALILIDDCDNMAYCPSGRFSIVFDKADEVMEALRGAK